MLRDVWGRIGTTAQRVLRRATVPVLLAAEVPPRAPPRLLIGVDDSDMIGPVVDWARLLLERFPAEAVAMHVVHPMQFDRSTVVTGGLSQVTGSMAVEVPVEEESIIRDAREWVVKQIDEELADNPDGSTLRTRIASAAVEGLPVAALISEATQGGAELVVVGSRGAGTARRLLLGSVAEGVLRDSPCPVLVVVRPAVGPG